MAKNEKHFRRQLLKMLSSFTQIAFMIAACLFIGVFLGKTLDSVFGTSPWLLLLFSLIGAAAAFKSLFEYSKKF